MDQDILSCSPEGDLRPNNFCESVKLVGDSHSVSDPSHFRSGSTSLSFPIHSRFHALWGMCSVTTGLQINMTKHNCSVSNSSAKNSLNWFCELSHLSFPFVIFCSLLRLSRELGLLAGAQNSQDCKTQLWFPPFESTHTVKC